MDLNEKNSKKADNVNRYPAIIIICNLSLHVMANVKSDHTVPIHVTEVMELIVISQYSSATIVYKIYFLYNQTKISYRYHF